MEIKYKDYYQLLGIKREASGEEIKRAYRRMAKRYHPDLHPEKDKARAAEKFKEINEAHEVLSDTRKKAKYDRLGADWQADREPAPHTGSGGAGFRHEFHAGEGSSSPEGSPEFTNSSGTGSPSPEAEGFGQFSRVSDFFETLFGGSRPQGFGGGRPFPGEPVKGQDIEAELSLSLEDAFRGGKKRLSLFAPAICAACGGSGRRNGGFCPACSGAGETKREKNIVVNLPNRTRNGMRIRLRGQGGQSPGKGQAGDLYLGIKLLPHPEYEVTGDNLEANVTVMPWDAALGGAVFVPSLDGPVRIRIPAGTRSGRKFRIAGRGLRKTDGSRGDLYAVVRIDIPDGITQEQKRLYGELKKAGM